MMGICGIFRTQEVTQRNANFYVGDKRLLILSPNYNYVPRDTLLDVTKELDRAIVRDDSFIGIADSSKGFILFSTDTMAFIMEGRDDEFQPLGHYLILPEEMSYDVKSQLYNNVMGEVCGFVHHLGNDRCITTIDGETLLIEKAGNSRDEYDVNGLLGTPKKANPMVLSEVFKSIRYSTQSYKSIISTSIGIYALLQGSTSYEFLMQF